jgi:hypothetical protein
MPMPLSQALLDRLAQLAMQVHGGLVETITYHARATATATPVDHTVAALFRDYRLAALSTGDILLRDQEGRIPTARVPWVPTHDDTITRADGTLWKVLSPRGGPGSPFWILQTRQVG